MTTRAPLDAMEDAIIDVEGVAFPLSLVCSGAPEKGEDYERAVDVIEGILHEQVKALRKAYDKCQKLVAKRPETRARLWVVHDADREPVAS
jgi:hypothetical protein